MAVFASTENPVGLRRRIEQFLGVELRMKWSPEIAPNAVKFIFLLDVDRFAYADEHGRLTRMLLAHFSDEITRVQVTPFDR